MLLSSQSMVCSSPSVEACRSLVLQLWQWHLSLRSNAKPIEVAQGSADDLGVMSISLKDVVKPQVGVQGQTQAAGTPNEAGIGGFLPLVVGRQQCVLR